MINKNKWGEGSEVEENDGVMVLWRHMNTHILEKVLDQVELEKVTLEDLQLFSSILNKKKNSSQLKRTCTLRSK